MSSIIPPIPPGLELYESKAPQCYAAAIATYLIALVAVVLRFWARRLMKTYFWLDDWTVAGALVGYQWRHRNPIIQHALTILTGACDWILHWYTCL